MDSVHTVWLGKMKCQPKNVPYDCCFVSFLVNRSKILYTVKIEVQQNLPLAHDFERSEKE